MALEIEDTIKGQLNNCNDLHFLVVDNMSKLMTGKVKSVESSDFNVSGLKWKFLIEPNKYSKDHLSFYLWIKEEKCMEFKWEVRFQYTISVVSQTGYDDKCYSLAGRSNEIQVIRGVRSFISYTELKERFLVNDSAVFCAKIFDVKPNFTVTSIPQSMGTAERLKLIDIPRNNCRFTWRIKQFSSFKIGENIPSYEFTVGQRRWVLWMYKRYNEGKGNSLLFKLHATDYVTDCPKWRTLAVYKLRALDQLHRNHSESTTLQEWFPYDPSEELLVWRTHLSLDELHKPSRGFLVNDHVHIGVEFFIVSTSEAIYP